MDANVALEIQIVCAKCCLSEPMRTQMDANVTKGAFGHLSFLSPPSFALSPEEGEGGRHIRRFYWVNEAGSMNSGILCMQHGDGREGSKIQTVKQTSYVDSPREKKGRKWRWGRPIAGWMDGVGQGHVDGRTGGGRPRCPARRTGSATPPPPPPRR